MKYKLLHPNKNIKDYGETWYIRMLPTILIFILIVSLSFLSEKIKLSFNPSLVIVPLILVSVIVIKYLLRKSTPDYIKPIDIIGYLEITDKKIVAFNHHSNIMVTTEKVDIVKVLLEQNFYKEVGNRYFNPNGLGRLLLDVKDTSKLEYKIIVKTLEEYKYLITTLKAYQNTKITPAVSNAILYASRKI